MTTPTTRPPSSYTKPSITPPGRYRRFPERSENGEWSVVCRCNCVFTPQRMLARLRAGGSGAIPCRECGMWLFLVGSRELGILVVETHPVELAWLKAEGYSGVAEVVYFTNPDIPVRTN